MIDGMYRTERLDLSLSVDHAIASDPPNISSRGNAPVTGSWPAKGLPPVKYPPKTLTDWSRSPCTPGRIVPFPANCALAAPAPANAVSRNPINLERVLIGFVCVADPSTNGRE